MYLSGIKKQGFEGSVDCSIEISLYEYGLVHKKTKEGFDFIHGVDVNHESDFFTFDRASFTEEEFQDLIEDGRWFDVNAVLSFVGQTLDEWLKFPLPTRIHDCMSYYGQDNIFGESSGFEITSRRCPASKEE